MDIHHHKFSIFIYTFTLYQITKFNILLLALENYAVLVVGYNTFCFSDITEEFFIWRINVLSI